MNRADALRQVAELHERWSLEWGDVVDPPADLRGSDASVWSAEMGASGEQQDDLNAQVAAILAQIDDGGNR